MVAMTEKEAAKDAKAFKELETTLTADIAALGSVKTKADIDKFINGLNIGSEMTTITRKFAVMSYQYGRSTKGKNEPINLEDAYVAFREKAHKADTSRKALTDSTKKTMVSFYGSLAELGRAAWDSTHAFAWIMHNAKISYTTRGAFIREVALLAEQPDDDKLATMLAEKDKAQPLNKAVAAVFKTLASLHQNYAELQDESTVQYKRFAAAVNAVNNLKQSCEVSGDDAISKMLADAA